jgi:hypothetical protein
LPAIAVSLPMNIWKPHRRKASSCGGLGGYLRALFNRVLIYFLKATVSCAVAYTYARIRRLVCLVSGLYRFRIAENSAIGFSDPTRDKRNSAPFFIATNLRFVVVDMVAVRGRPLGLPGLIPPGSLTCVQLPPLLV